MTLKEAITDALSEWHVEDLKIDKDERRNGLEAVNVTVTIEGKPVAFSYAKKLGMSNEHAASVLKSYVRRSFS